MAWPIKTIKREIKNSLGGFSETQVLVRDCTSNVAEPVGDIPLRKITWAVCEDQTTMTEVLEMLFRRIVDIEFPCHQTRALLVLYHLLFYMDPPNDLVVKQISKECMEPSRYLALKNIATQKGEGIFPREFASQAHRKKLAKTIVQFLRQQRQEQQLPSSPEQVPRTKTSTTTNGSSTKAKHIKHPPSPRKEPSADEQKRAAQFAKDMAAISLRESVATNEDLFDLSIFSEAFQDALWDNTGDNSNNSKNVLSTASSSSSPFLALPSSAPVSSAPVSSAPVSYVPVSPAPVSSTPVSLVPVSSTPPLSSVAKPSSVVTSRSLSPAVTSAKNVPSSSSSSSSAASSASSPNLFSTAEQQLFMSFLDAPRTSKPSNQALDLFSLPPLSSTLPPPTLSAPTSPPNSQLQQQQSWPTATWGSPQSFASPTQSAVASSSSYPPSCSSYPPSCSSTFVQVSQPPQPTIYAPAASVTTAKPAPLQNSPAPSSNSGNANGDSGSGTASSNGSSYANGSGGAGSQPFKPPPPLGLPRNFKPPPPNSLPPNQHKNNHHHHHHAKDPRQKPSASPQQQQQKLLSPLDVTKTKPIRRSLAVPSTPGNSVQVWGCHVCQSINHMSMRSCANCFAQRDSERGAKVRDTTWMGEAKEDAAVTAKELARRQKITEELFETEKSYVASIRTVITVVADELERQGVKVLGVTAEQQLSIFANLRAIAQLHTLLFADLQSEQDPIRVFFKYMDFFKIYSQYLNNYDVAVETIKRLRATNPKFVAFLNDRHSQLHDMALESYLIMPVQRVPRYVLLLKELVRSTPPSDPKRAASEKALAKVEKIALYVNDSMKERQVQCHLWDIQQRMHGQVLLVGRRFVREAPCHVVRLNDKGQKERKPRVAYLFADRLMITKDPSYNLKHMLPLKQFTVSDDPSKFLNQVDQHVGVVLCLKDDPSIPANKRSKESVFGLVLETFEEKEAWRRVLKEEIARATPLCQDE